MGSNIKGPHVAKIAESEKKLTRQLLLPTVFIATTEDTVVAKATTKKVNEQDTNTFPKCYVGRNGN